MSTESKHYRYQPLAEGLVAALARAAGHSICNSGLVDLGGATLVFDTGMTPHSANELRAGDGLPGRSAPSMAANSHWHFDHMLGNQRFAGLPIFGTHRTREIMLERMDELSAELTHASIQRGLRELEALADTAPTELARADARVFAQLNRALLAANEPLKITPPDRTFSARLDLPGDRGAELLSFGAGHTEADAILHLPKERIVFAGDLVLAGFQPSMGSGDPEHWLEVLDRIEALHPERIVPGHGPVTTVDAGLRETRRYVTAVIEASAEPAGSPLPAALARFEGSPSLGWNLEFARARRATKEH